MLPHLKKPVQAGEVVLHIYSRFGEAPPAASSNRSPSSQAISASRRPAGRRCDGAARNKRSSTSVPSGPASRAARGSWSRISGGSASQSAVFT